MKVAIVGTGVAGLAAARALARRCELVLYEAGPHVGGHVHTHELDVAGRRLAVDSGFIVFNERTYPLFCALLRELGVESQASEMSFSVSSRSTGLEWSGTNLDTLFARRSSLLRPSFQRMLLDVLRFGNESLELLEDREARWSLGEWLEARGYSRAFREHYLYPMAAAIWSAPPGDMAAFPASFLVRFFENHGMLRVRGRPQWRVVRGGSRAYVEALVRPFADRIRLRTPVRRVRRLAQGVELELADGSRETCDQLVLATHSDQALGLLADSTREEREILGAIPYQENEALLHTDPALLPRRRKCWSSWNVHLPDADAPAGRPIAVTYWMNRLQSLDVPVPLCVTLNRSDAVDPSKVLRRMVYHHPLFTRAALAAQARRGEIQGWRRTWYCGAYWGFGFHEDGVRSAVDVVQGLTKLVRPLEVRA